MSVRTEEFVSEVGPGGPGDQRGPRVVRVRPPSVDELFEGISAGERSALARAISLVESSSAKHRALAEELVARAMPVSGGSVRIGVTGVPGVGKSTFIEALGTMLTGRGEKVAVLAIDPSSGVSGGSILGDKTRMGALSADANAFVRPSPSRGTLGGVTRRTRETVLLCEAAGFGVTLVETVGVGQSETAVAELTDAVLALMLPNAGDELQGIKRGLLELADVIAVNKADGENVRAAMRASAEHSAALRCQSRDDDWEPLVRTCSALTGDGIADVWEAVGDRVSHLRTTGGLARRRQGQLAGWFAGLAEEALLGAFHTDAAVRTKRDELEGMVRSGAVTPAGAARALVRVFLGGDEKEASE